MAIAGVGAGYGNSEIFTKRGTSTGKNEGIKKDYTKKEMFEIIAERKQEIYEKVKNNDTETSFQIGSQSFTIKEWDKLLKQFDLAEEKIKEQMQTEQEKRQKEATTKANRLETEENNISVMDSLVTESTVCTYPEADEQETAKMYITCYTEEGIFCREAGQTEGYLWKIAFENTSQYDKVMKFLDELKADTDYRFAAREDFWRDFLKE